MSIELGRRVLASDLVSDEDFARALFVAVTTGVPLVRALFARALLSEGELARDAELTGALALRGVVPAPELVERLPEGLCRRLGVLPLRQDPFSGVVDFAALDPLDPHLERELAYHLGGPVRLLRAPAAALDDALQRLAGEPAPAPPRAIPPPPRKRRLTPAFPHGAPRTSAPPPPSDHLPIPLVRRSALQHAAAPSVEPTRGRTSRRTLRVAAPEGSSEASLDRHAVLPREASVGPTEPTTRRGTGPLAPLPDATAPAEAPPLWSSIEDAARSVGEPAAPSRPTPAQGTPAAGGARGARRSRRAIAPSRPAPPEASAAPSASAPPPASPRVIDPDASLDRVRAAPGRDDVIAAVLAALRLVARRVAIVAVRKDGYRGLACDAAFAEPEAFLRLIVPLGVPSLFATAAAAAVYLGPIPENAVHGPLLAVMKRASRDVAAAAVRPKGRPALILLADDLGDTASGTRTMMAIADAAAEALVRILSSRA